MRYQFHTAKKLMDDAGGRIPEHAILELKYDGVRAIWDGVEGRLYSRRDIAQNGRVPEVLPFLPKNVVLDGELVVFDQTGVSDMSALAHRGSTAAANRIAAKVQPATYIAFDLLEIDGVRITDAPLGERLRRLHERVPKVSAPSGASILDHPRTWPGSAFEPTKQYVIDAGEEGLMVKDLDRPYTITNGKETRTDAWLKWKAWVYRGFEILRWGLHRDLHPGHDDVGHDTTVAIIQTRGREQCVVLGKPEYRQKVKEGATAIVVRYLEETEDGALRFGTCKGVASTLQSAEQWIKLRLE